MRDPLDTSMRILIATLLGALILGLTGFFIGFVGPSSSTRNPIRGRCWGYSSRGRSAASSARCSGSSSEPSGNSAANPTPARLHLRPIIPRPTTATRRLNAAEPKKALPLARLSSCLR